jgi:hypothetical protein
VCLYFSEFILRFNDAIILVIGHVSVESKTSMITLSILTYADSKMLLGLSVSSQGEYALVYMNVYICTRSKKRTLIYACGY